MKASIEDDSGKRWSGELTPIEDMAREGQAPAEGTATPPRFGNTIFPERTEASLRKAIGASWAYYKEQYENYELDPNINYPSEAWARSQGSAPLAIELAPGETKLSGLLCVPANMQIRGTGNWSGSTLRCSGSAAVCLLGDIKTDFGDVKPFGGGLERLRLAGSDGPLIDLYGSFQDLRLDRLHIISKGSNTADILHFRPTPEQEAGRGQTEWSTPFGKVNLLQPHIKELVVSNGQFESGNTTLYLTAPMRCRIIDNQFLYGELGMAIHEASELFVANNTFNGGLKCPAIIEGSSRNGYITFANNPMDGCLSGAQLYLGDQVKEVTDANNFWNGGLDSRSVDYYKKGQKVKVGYGVFKTGDSL